MTNKNRNLEGKVLRRTSLAGGKPSRVFIPTWKDVVAYVVISGGIIAGVVGYSERLDHKKSEERALIRDTLLFESSRPYGVIEYTVSDTNRDGNADLIHKYFSSVDKNGSIKRQRDPHRIFREGDAGFEDIYKAAMSARDKSN